MKQNHLPPPDFDPVPVRRRSDGWTPERQRAFIAELARSRCIIRTCRHVGLSSESAYKLYRRADAASFRAAWDTVLAPASPPRRPSTSDLTDTHELRAGHQLAKRQLPATAPAGSRPSRPEYSLETFIGIVRKRKSARVTP